MNKLIVVICITLLSGCGGTPPRIYGQSCDVMLDVMTDFRYDHGSRSIHTHHLEDLFGAAEGGARIVKQYYSESQDAVFEVDAIRWDCYAEPSRYNYCSGRQYFYAYSQPGSDTVFGWEMSCR